MLRNSVFVAGILALVAFSLTAAPAFAEKRVALVIGNSAYSHASPLKNPKNDAEAMAAKLRALGFDVVTGIDLNHRGFAKTIGQFKRKLEHASIALFFYAGHGLQVRNQNYLAPIDASLDDETALEFEAVKLSTVLALMERRRRTNIVLLDACRDNPLARNLARGMGTRSTVIGRGLARVETGVGTLIAFATQPGNVALDGDDRHSPFTKGLVKHIATPGLDVALMMRRVRQDVIDITGGRQIPWQHSSLTAPFMFKEKPRPAVAAKQSKPVVAKKRESAVASPPRSSADRSAIELAFWDTVKEQATKQAYEAYLANFPDGAFAPLAQLKLDQFAASERAETKTAALQKEESAGAEDEAASATSKYEMALLLQNELRRLGCFTGTLDGDWGKKSRAALARFNKHAKLTLPVEEPVRGTIDMLKAREGRVCPAPPKKKTVKRKVVKKAPVAPRVSKPKPKAFRSWDQQCTQYGKAEVACD